MDVLIIFAIVFSPFLLFVFWAYRANKKLPESAIAHLDDQVYQLDSRNGLKVVLFDMLLYGLVAIMLLSIVLVFLVIPTDPISIPRGLKEVLALIFAFALLPLFFLGFSAVIHNTWRMTKVVLDLKPGLGLIGWQDGRNYLNLTKEDFVQINAVQRDGRHPDVVWEFCLKGGEKLYLSLVHPGGEALLTMLKGVPYTSTFYHFPLVPVRAPGLLMLMRQGFDWTTRNFVYEVAAILFFLLTIYGMDYYEKNQRNLDQLLPSRQLKVVGDDIRIGTKGGKNRYLWVNDGRYTYDVRVPKHLYEEGIRNGVTTMYYNRYINKYIYKSSDFAMSRFFRWCMAGLTVFLIGRIYWLLQRRYKKSHDLLSV